VTITVNGKVVAKPCTIATPKATVDLGDLYTFNMLSPGSASGWHDVTLDLSNCPVGTSRVTATFSGTADSTGYYKIREPRATSSWSCRTPAEPGLTTAQAKRWPSTMPRNPPAFHCASER
jgi:type 1 fimbria pilin